MARKKFQKKGPKRSSPRIYKQADVRDVQSFSVGRNLHGSFLKRPMGTLPGADYSTRKVCNTMSVQTGFSNVGSTTAGQMIQNSATTLNLAYAFSLDDIPGLSALTSEFDQYRIDRLRVHFKARNNAVNLVNIASPNSAVPTGYAVVDRDDATVLSGVSQAQEYNNCITFNGEEDFTVDLIPSITVATYASAAFSGYSPVPSNSIWLDVANTSIPAYGIKISLGGLTATTTSSWVWDVIPEVILSFKAPR